MICCARIGLEPETVGRLNFFTWQEIDWDYLLSAAEKHRVMPLLYRSLSKAPSPGVPEPILKRMQTFYRRNARRNLLLGGRLLGLLSLLEKERIAAVPFKGPVLAETAYGDIALRQFGDLDILVRESDAVQARELMVARGYRAELDLDNSQYQSFLETKNSTALFNADCGFSIDLHTTLTKKYTPVVIDLDFVKPGLQSVALAGHHVVSLCDPDQLVYLCINGAAHRYMALEHICSLAALLHARPDLNWTRATDLAATLQCRRILLLGLFLVHDLFEAPMPHAILQAAQSDSKIPELAAYVYRKLFDQAAGAAKNGFRRKFSFFHLNVRDSFAEKVRYGWHLATSPTMRDWRNMPLPAGLAPVLRVYRPIRLTTKYAGALWKRKEKGKR